MGWIGSAICVAGMIRLSMTLKLKQINGGGGGNQGATLNVRSE